MNKKAMYNLTYGLFVLTAQENGRNNGCITNTAIQVTSEPNRITIAVNKANFTQDMIYRTGKFNISVLSEKADFALFQRFGFQSGRDVDKFRDFSDYAVAANGITYITVGTNAWLSCETEQQVDLGTHTLFIAQVTDMDVLSEDPSVTYAYYQKNIKPAPGEVQKPDPGMHIWRCKVCGYEYTGRELPDDFICPICKHPASDFEMIQ